MAGGYSRWRKWLRGVWRLPGAAVAGIQEWVREEKEWAREEKEWARMKRAYGFTPDDATQLHQQNRTLTARILELENQVLRLGGGLGRE